MILRDGTKIPRPKNEPKHKPSKYPKKKETDPSETNELIPQNKEPLEKEDSFSKKK
jgi:hypothetical protein